MPNFCADIAQADTTAFSVALERVNERVNERLYCDAAFSRTAERVSGWRASLTLPD
ncbi:hypothetical protein BSU04_04625 [Caballeronia sordidicola]|uniref:Uncharacterized protein n=1 Tax=Caballeronia sordidicola TaxID=196367 RepID=A0A226X8L1_CABSO|nr:hypothetical protein BSU04_04625 [Caballeronia sordidicola]